MYAPVSGGLRMLDVVIFLLVSMPKLMIDVSWYLVGQDIIAKVYQVPTVMSDDDILYRNQTLNVLMTYPWLFRH